MPSEQSLGTYFDALYQITLRMSSSLEIGDVLSYVTEEVTRAVNAKGSVVRLLDASGEQLEIRAVYGLSQNYLSKGPVIVARSQVDREILSGNPSQVADVRSDASFQYPEEAAREGIVSVASVPLIAKGKAIGVLRVYAAERRRYSEEQMRFLVAVADLAALCIENAMLYDQMRSQYEDTMNTLWGVGPA